MHSAGNPEHIDAVHSGFELNFLSMIHCSSRDYERHQKSPTLRPSPISKTFTSSIASQQPNMASTLSPPAGSLTSGLVFDGKPYDVTRDDPLNVFQHNASRVREYIKKRLAVC